MTVTSYLAKPLTCIPYARDIAESYGSGPDHDVMEAHYRIAAALAGLRLRLPRMGAYVEHARAIAGALSGIDGVEVVPDPPQTPMMHLHLRTTPAALTAGVRRLATEDRLWTFGGSLPADTPGFRRVELYAGDATLALSAQEVAAAVRALLPA
jgi:hypothetical protein